MSAKKKRIIVVLGMHRSGTSAVARSLQVLGVTLGNNLIPPMKDVNEKGFWEDVDLNMLNNELLKVLDNDWHHLAPIRTDDTKTLISGSYFDKATQLLDQKIENIEIFGFKDPRLAKLLSFWREVFDSCQLEASCIVAVRHPLSVAKSLAKRDGFEAEKSYFLWLGHVILSLCNSMGLKRVLVDYDKLMRSPRHEISRIANRLDLEMDLPELQKYESDFLDNTLRHSVYEPDDLSADRACPPLAKEVYTTLLDVASDKMDLDDPALRLLAERWMDEYERLDSILSLVDRFSERIAISSQTIVERDARIAGLDQVVTDRDNQIATLQHALNERNTLIADLEQAKALQDSKIEDLQDQIESIYNSSFVRLAHRVRALKSTFTFSSRPKNPGGSATPNTNSRNDPENPGGSI